LSQPSFRRNLHFSVVFVNKLAHPAPIPGRRPQGEKNVHMSVRAQSVKAREHSSNVHSHSEDMHKEKRRGPNPRGSDVPP
jgi:hypothetical protein